MQKGFEKGKFYVIMEEEMNGVIVGFAIVYFAVLFIFIGKK